ncbi:hypothetical protein BH09ACT5_BH09ACT5_14060 [soil metagenome]
MTVLTHPLPLGRRVLAAALAGLATAVVAHAITVFVFYVTQASGVETILPISNYFGVGTLALFVLATIAALLGGLRRWYVAVPVGILLGVLAESAGLVHLILSQGAWTDQALPALLQVLGTNLLYVAAAAFAAVCVGRRAWWAVASLLPRPRALVRMPSSRLAEGQLTHLERVPVDEELADAQWEAYVATLESEGFETVAVPPSDEHPDSVFVEDTIVIFGGTAVITRPGAESRRTEPDALRPLARRLGYAVRAIEGPGTLDGGDVLKVGTTVYVGRGGRTNAEGIAQLREIVAPLGYRVVPVPVTTVLHLKSAVTALPDGTVVGHPGQVDSPAAFDRFLALPEPGAAVVVLSDSAVLMAASVPKSVELVESLGYRVVTVDVSEFEKLEGCVTCLSVRLR